MAGTPDHIYLCGGSNLGDREVNLARARELLEARGYRVLRESALYETEPWGGAEGDNFINVVWELEYQGTSRELLEATQSVEAELGRVPDARYAPRICDLDILFFGSQIVNELDLTIPHPRIPERRFVLRPLCDLIPDKVHPESGKTFLALLAGVRDELSVRKLTRQETPHPA